MGKAKIPLARATLVKVWRDNSRRVRTHEKKIEALVRPLGKIIQTIFLCPIGSQYSMDCLKMVWWDVGNQGLKRFFPNHLTAPRPPRMETGPLVAWVWLLKFLHQGDCEWLTPCPLGRHSGAMRSFPWWPEPALPLPFSSKVCLLVFATKKERPFNPPYKSFPLSLLYHPIKKTSKKFYQRALNMITFWWFLQAWKQFQCLKIVLGRFPFVRTDRPDHSSHNENFTFNQNHHSDPK